MCDPFASDATKKQIDLFFKLVKYEFFPIGPNKAITDQFGHVAYHLHGFIFNSRRNLSPSYALNTSASVAMTRGVGRFCSAS